nr:MAG TPA: hypothetical protein [Caudoviricetes sp.]
MAHAWPPACRVCAALYQACRASRPARVQCAKSFGAPRVVVLAHTINGAVLRPNSRYWFSKHFADARTDTRRNRFAVQHLRHGRARQAKFVGYSRQGDSCHAQFGFYLLRMHTIQQNKLGAPRRCIC